jgi:hypothetical protein
MIPLPLFCTAQLFVCLFVKRLQLAVTDETET